jgi:hypothetical protein
MSKKQKSKLVRKLVLSPKRAKFTSGKAKFSFMCERSGEYLTLNKINFADYRPKSN